ncbi:MAG: cardiolipin synthase [Oscillospiraceae bacterium]
MKKAKNFLYKRLRLMTIILIIVIQIIVFLSLIFALSNKFIYSYILLLSISIISTIFVVNKRTKSEFKISWIILIMVLPIFGGVFYLVFGTTLFNKKLRIDMIYTFNNACKNLTYNEEYLEDLKKQDMSVYKQSIYLQNFSLAPLYKNTYNKYLSSGEEKFEVMLEEIKKAKKFIFLEYFIIDEGYLWSNVLEALKEKVNEGLDVRLLYDDAGCVSTLPNKYNEYLKQIGIKCKVFNPLRASMSIVKNYRNHRKILIVDGDVAITGGINLADEYINKVERFGHWKDAAILLKGEGVYSFTIMFLHFWNFDDVEDSDFADFKPTIKLGDNIKGFVQPYCDSPMDLETTSQCVYLNIINNAKEYIYIYTPYFIVDSELLTALCLAAKSGIKVKIVTPFIPDKPIVNMITKSYYRELIEASVEVLEYKIGFVHSKCILCDDNIGIIGTINFDYRSLYHHFECGVFLYDTDCLEDLKKDFIETFKKTLKITLEDTYNKSFYYRLLRGVLKVFAPLM